MEKNGQRILIDTSPKNLYKWPISNEKILNNIIYQRNSNQNQNKISLYTTLGWLESKCQIISVGKDLEKPECLYTPGMNIKWFVCFGT